MGLDCIPLGRAKPGHQEEWSQLMAILYNGGELDKAQDKRRSNISTGTFVAIGAPQIGFDGAADQWALEHKQNPEISDAEHLERMKGAYVLALAPESDGIPRYSNGGQYDNVDETCFRGSFLRFCEDVCDPDLIEEAWNEMMRPEHAVIYGKALLKAASKAKSLPQEQPAKKPGAGVLNTGTDGYSRKRRQVVHLLGQPRTSDLGLFLNPIPAGL